MDEVFALIFGALLILTLLWFVLLKWIFQKLEKNHFDKYEQMGKPSLFLNNNFKTVLATLKFICKREHKNLGDVALSKLSDIALVFLLVHTIIFCALFFGGRFWVNAT